MKNHFGERVAFKGPSAARQTMSRRQTFLEELVLSSTFCGNHRVDEFESETIFGSKQVCAGSVQVLPLNSAGFGL